MGARRKAIRMGILFIVLLIVSGIVLMYRGNDAVVLATQKKRCHTNGGANKVVV